MGYNDICPVEYDLNRYMNRLDKDERAEEHIERITNDLLDEWNDKSKSFAGALEAIEASDIDPTRVLAQMISNDADSRNLFRRLVKGQARILAKHKVEQVGLASLEYYEHERDRA